MTDILSRFRAIGATKSTLWGNGYMPATYGVKYLFIMMIAPLSLLGQAKADVEIRLSTGHYGHHPALVEGALEQFLGEEDEAPSHGGGKEQDDAENGGLGALLDTGRIETLHELGLVWEGREALGSGQILGFGGAVSIGQARYHLPDGVDVFLDPLTLRVDSLAVSAHLGPAFDLGEIGPFFMTLKTGAGLEWVYARIRANSALIALERHETFFDQYLYAAFDAGLSSSPATGLRVSLQRTSNGPLVLQLGLVRKF